MARQALDRHTVGEARRRLGQGQGQEVDAKAMDGVTSPLFHITKEEAAASGTPRPAPCVPAVLGHRTGCPPFKNGKEEQARVAM